MRGDGGGVMRRGGSVVVLAFAGALAGAQGARADSVDLPRACPPGSRGQTAHEGQWCTIADCAGGCREGEACTTLRVCTQIASVIPGGLRPSEPPPEPRELVIATCDASSACTGLEEPPPPTVGTLPSTPPTCAERRVCVASPLPDLPPSPAPAASAPTAPLPPPATGDTSGSSSCACRGPGSHRATSGSALGVGLALFAVWRARRRAAR